MHVYNNSANPTVLSFKYNVYNRYDSFKEDFHNSSCAQMIVFAFNSFKNSKTKATVYRFLENQENNIFIHIAKNNYNEVYWSSSRKGKEFSCQISNWLSFKPSLEPYDLLQQ